MIRRGGLERHVRGASTTDQQQTKLFFAGRQPRPYSATQKHGWIQVRNVGQDPRPRPDSSESTREAGNKYTGVSPCHWVFQPVRQSLVH